MMMMMMIIIIIIIINIIMIIILLLLLLLLVLLRTLIGANTMVTMEQSAEYWRNTHTHVHRTHSLTHFVLERCFPLTYRTSYNVLGNVPPAYL